MIGRVRLAGEHELNGSIWVEQQSAQAVGLRQQQGGSLVCSEASCEADGENVGVEHIGAPTSAHIVHEA